MRKIRKYIFIIVFCITLLILTKSNAAGQISLSANKSTVEVGEEFTVSVNLANASVATLTARVSVDSSKVDYVSGPSNSSFKNGRAIYTWTDPTGGDNPKTGGTIVTFKFKAKQTGKASFSVNGDFYSPDEKNINPSFSGTSVTIKEKQVTPPPSSGGNTGGSSGGTTGGNNNSGTTGGSNSGSNQNKPSGGTTQGTSKNANLKELHLDVEGLSPNFNKNTTNYNIVVGNDKNSINVTAVPEDSNANVSITGNKNIKVGTSKIQVKVTAQDKKTTKTYTINVTKTDNPELANASLENLAIENVTLEPEFNKGIFEYRGEISSDTNTLNILAVPQIEGAKVEIKGLENLSFGENTIEITVTAKNGETVQNYIIKLYKKTVEEENSEVEPINLEGTIPNIEVNEPRTKL